MFEVKGLENIFGENKGADQLCSYHAFDLSVYFLHMQKEDFFMTGLNYTLAIEMICCIEDLDK